MCNASVQFLSESMVPARFILLVVYTSMRAGTYSPQAGAGGWNNCVIDLCLALGVIPPSGAQRMCIIKDQLSTNENEPLLG